MSIRTRLMMSLAIVVSMLFVITGVLNFQATYNNTEQQVYESFSQIGQSAVKRVSRWFETKKNVINSGIVALRSGSSRQFSLMQGQLAGNFDVMYLGSQAGDMLTYPEIVLPEDFDPRTRPWFIKAQESGKLIVTAPFIDASTGDMIVAFAQPSVGGVIGADIKLNDVIDEVVSIRMGETGFAAIVDSQNHYIIHPDSSKIGELSPVLQDNSTRQEKLKTYNIDDQQWFMASFDIVGSEWKLVLFQAESDAFSGLTEAMQLQLLESIVTIAMLMLFCGYTIAKMLRPIAELNSAMSNICGGEANLTKRLNIKSKDEIGKLSHAFNSFLAIIQQLIIEIKGSSKGLTRISSEIQQTSEKNSRAIQSQQNQISSLVTTMTQVADSSANASISARETALSAQKAASEGHKGIENVAENKLRMAKLNTQIELATETINELHEHAQNINNILTTIQGIAEQTNLLALNAAIEAARAGEQGRGFAVVADEVRALSARTHQATGEINKMLSQLQSKTSEAVKIMNEGSSLTAKTSQSGLEVTESLMFIASAIEDISQNSNHIADSSKQQHEAIENTKLAVSELMKAATTLSDNVVQAQSQSEQLNALSQTVNGHLGRFIT